MKVLIAVTLIHILIGNSIANNETNFQFKNHNNEVLYYSKDVEVETNVSRFHCNIQCAKMGNKKCRFTNWTPTGDYESGIGNCHLYIEEENSVIKQYLFSSGFNQTIMVYHRKDHTPQFQTPVTAPPGWNSWLTSVPCQRTCGPSTWQRTRSCVDNQANVQPDDACEGDANEVNDCNLPACSSDIQSIDSFKSLQGVMDYCVSIGKSILTLDPDNLPDLSGLTPYKRHWFECLPAAVHSVCFCSGKPLIRPSPNASPQFECEVPEKYFNTACM